MTGLEVTFQRIEMEKMTIMCFFPCLFCSHLENHRLLFDTQTKNTIWVITVHVKIQSHGVRGIFLYFIAVHSDIVFFVKRPSALPCTFTSVGSSEVSCSSSWPSAMTLTTLRQQHAGQGASERGQVGGGRCTNMPAHNYNLTPQAVAQWKLQLFHWGIYNLSFSF